MSDPEPLQEWKKTQGLGIPTFVGDFYECLTKNLVPGVMAADSYEEGDLIVHIDDEISIGIEVKGAANTSSIRVRVTQLEDHEERWRKFPYEDGEFLYFFFGYVNRPRVGKGSNKRRRKPRVRREVQSGKGLEFLARETNQLWVVPLSAVKLLSTDRSVRDTWFPSGDDQSPAWGIGRYLLRRAAKKPGQFLGEGWTSKRGEISGRFSLRVKENQRRLRMKFSVTVFQNGGPTLPLKRVRWEE